MQQEYDSYQLVLKATEEKVEQLLGRQVTSSNSVERGGIKNLSDGFCYPGTAAKTIRKFIAVYCDTNSCWKNSSRLFEALQLLLDYLGKVQRSDGTFDLPNTNFYSAPDTAFMCHDLVYSYRMLQKYDPENNATLSQELNDLIEKSGKGLIEGGFHTPNHRWVIASASMMIYNLTANDRLRETDLRVMRQVDTGGLA